MRAQTSIVLGAVLVLTSVSGVALGAYNQWDYWASWDWSTKFSSEEAAAEHMREGPNSLDSELTVPRNIVYMQDNYYQREWGVEPVDPEESEWVYESSCEPSVSYSDWEEARDTCWALTQTAEDPVCEGTWYVSGESAWQEGGYFMPGVYPTYRIKWVEYISFGKENLPEPHCSSTPAENAFYVQGFRVVECPTGYSADYSTNMCVSSHKGYTLGKVNPPCGPERGNPCDVGSGAKWLREVDYSGPGIEFVRMYNSKTSPKWTTNFTTYLAILPGSYQMTGVVLNGNSQEPMTHYGGGKYVAKSGSGLQVRSVSGEWVLYYPSGAKEYFSATDGRMLRRESAEGQVTTFNYTDNKMSSVVGPFGHTLTFVNNSLGQLEKIIDADGNEIEYEADSLGRVERVTYQDGSYRDYHYEDLDYPEHLTGITDENDDRYATYEYDDDGRVINSYHAGGYGGVSLSYAASSTTVVDAESNSTTYNFTTADYYVRKLTSEVLDGGTRTIGYGAYFWGWQGRPTSITDENGNVTQYVYDSFHKTQEVQAYGSSEQRAIDFSYLEETSDRPTLVESPSVYASGSREVETTYNGDDLPETIEISGYTPTGSAVSRVVTFEYNDAGQVTEIDGPRTDVSDVTEITYYECTTGDECGQIETITNALGHVTSFNSYDAHGRVTLVTDPNGLETSYAYDLRGRLTEIVETPPTGPTRTTSYTYDDSGQLETVTSPNGMVFSYAYDAAHNLISITDNLGNEIEFGYDLNGNVTDEDVRDSSSNLKKVVDYTYDARNRIDTINAGGSVTDLVFDAVGRLTDETDPNSNDTAHDYDPLNRLIETLDALSGVTELGYDVNDYLTSVEAPNGATTTYTYDDLGNLLSVSSPDTGTTSYTYDAAGNRLSRTDANSVTVDFAYDALNRLVSVEYSNSALDVALTYDGGTNQKGRLTAMSDGAGATTFAYDVFRNLTSESKTIDGNAHVTSYAYDDADLLESITYPSGRTVDYTRNVLGQITEAETTYGTTTITVADSIAYEPFGPLVTLTFGNSLVMDRDFDTQYRLTDQSTGSIQDLSYTHDAAGNIDAIADGVDSGLDQSFTQDDLHRIDYESGAYGTKDYTYDAVGNRLTRDHDTGSVTTQTLTYTTDSNRIATHDGQTVSIDAAGNTTADPARNLSFTYDDHNRMVEAYVGAVLQASYVYNGDGQRIKKVEATGAERTFVFHYGLDGELIGETVYDDLGAKIGERDYIWLDDLPVAQSERAFSGATITAQTFVYLHADHLDTPRLATNASGTVVWRWDSDAFGIGDADLDPDLDTNEVDVRLRFPGQYLDEETGLHYNYYRDYDPVSGRYVESDPIGLSGGLNTFAYVDGAPLRWTDPMGLAKGGKQNIRDTGLRNMSDEELDDMARNGTKEQRRRAQREQKARALRNVAKRRVRGNLGKVRVFIPLTIWEILQEFCRDGIHVGIGCVSISDDVCPSEV